MSVKQTGENAAQEFFETYIYMTTYDEARDIISEYTKDISDPILKEAVESSMNVLVFGAVMHMVKKQEEMVAWIFDQADIILVLLTRQARKLLDKVRGYKGSKLSRLLNFIQGNNQENLMTAQMVATHSGFKSNARIQSKYSTNPISAYQMQMDTKQTLYQRENLHMQFGSGMASRYNETLLFKLFTKSFTAQDEMLIKKILGRDTGAVLNVEDLNQVADFLFVKDTEGKIMGLSEAFYSLINGLGYMHNKA